MKTLFSIFGLIAVCTFFAGCFSFVSASSERLTGSSVAGAKGTPKEHVVVSNYGWYLFNTIPLVCGNARRPKSNEGCPFVFFRNDVTPDLMHGHLTAHAAKQNLDVAEINVFYDENVLFQLSGTTIPIPVPYVLCYHELAVSGVLMDTTPPPSAKTFPPASDKSAANDSNVDERKRDLSRLLDKIPDGGVK